MRQELRQVQRITRNYRYVQGWVLVPYGVVILLMSLWLLAWKTQGIPGPVQVAPAGVDGGLWYLGIWGVGLALATGLAFLAARHYKRVFGVVRPNVNDQLIDWISPLVLLAGWFVGDVITFHLHPPVNALALTLGALLALWWAITGRFRTQYLVFAAILILCGFLPLLNPTWDPLKVSKQDNPLILMTLGAVLLLGGLFDHLLLVRAFTRLREVHHARSV